MNLRNLFADTGREQEFQAGATVFTQGDPGNVMYVVLDGEVEVRAPNGFAEILVPGEILGEMALVDAKARSATVVAKSNCRLVPVDEKDFLFMVDETPLFALHVMRVLAQRLRRRLET